ncbi:hypothetical protein [Gudongella oleilytica]|uniref:hypothetical protein n=1 Tax=Gudongella oleilytica TaxID=1582259 RepID=UPI002A35B909|nr:hypothetical protein [Gudongella oleilytica]MDY0257301.1 hypothetical protein [Gudongella oleilytica]
MGYYDEDDKSRNDANITGYVTDPYSPVTNRVGWESNIDQFGYVIDPRYPVNHDPYKIGDEYVNDTISSASFLDKKSGKIILALIGTTFIVLALMDVISNLATASVKVLPIGVIGLIGSTLALIKFKHILLVLIRIVSGFIVTAGLLDKYFISFFTATVYSIADKNIILVLTIMFLLNFLKVVLYFGLFPIIFKLSNMWRKGDA